MIYNQAHTRRLYANGLRGELLAYFPIPLTKYGVTVYPKTFGYQKRFEIRPRYWAFYDFADHSLNSDELLAQLPKQVN